MAQIETTLSQLLYYRSERNIPVYITDHVEDRKQVDVYVQAESDILLHTVESKDNPVIKRIAKYANKPIKFYDKRVVTHNFADENDWPVDLSGNPISNYVITPDTGKKYVVTFIQVRFPKKLRLKSTNKLYFSVNLWIDAYQAVVPVVYLEYSSVKEIVRKTNTPLQIPIDIVDDLSNNKMIELQFRYANPDNLEGSPIVLRASKNEYIEIGLTGNIRLKDIDDLDFNGDETWAVVNGKQVIDF